MSDFSKTLIESMAKNLINKSLVKSVLIRLPVLATLIRKYDKLQEKIAYLSQQLAQAEQLLLQKDTETMLTRYQLVDGFIRYLMQREPKEDEISHYSNSSLTDREIFIQLFTSDDYQSRLQIPKNNTLFGVLTKAEAIKSYLLYPSFDQAQLFTTLTSEPYQLSDFNACLDFLKERNWLIPDKTTFLDIGANIGSMSLYAISSGYFTQAIGVEASSLNYQFMQWNISINNLESQVHVLNYGLADFIGEQDLICSPYNCGDFRMSSQQTDNPENLYHEEQFNLEKVQFSTLDYLSEQHNIVAEKIGLICIDCQGSEGLIFKGGKEFLQRVKAPIYVEFWPYGINRLNCKDEYFEFITQYANEIFRWIDKEVQPITLDFLRDFYETNLHTTLHLDILLLPLKNS
jgi:FkbM family methyltransferase